jgi:hypothetical protein
MRSLGERLGAGAVALLVVAGCAGSGERDAGGEPEVGPAPTTSDASSLRLPLDAYLPSTSDVGRIVRAQGVLTLACMRKFGFDYQPAEKPAQPAPPPGHARRYGITDASLAAAYGYGLPRTEGEATSGRQSSRTPDPVEVAVLLGRGQRSYAGKPVPDGGCLGEARRTIEAAGPDLADPHLAQQLAVESFDRSRQDSRVRAVFAAWSACMRAEGYDYGDPLDPPADPTLGERRTREAIDTALADIRCKVETNLVGVWFAVESVYQRRSVEANHEALETIKESNVAQLRQAADVLGR